MFWKIVVLNYCSSYIFHKMASTKMDIDKENMHRTRIPLPKDPLPALPRHLLVENKKSHHTQQNNLRYPLNTLNGQVVPTAGPSKVVVHKPRISIDAKHVTVRPKREKLDWQYSVFKDEHIESNTSVINISDDEEYLDNLETQQYFNGSKKINNLGAAFAAVTPNLKACLESNRVRNIKRSLKRPHSRELLNLSPPVKQDKVEDKAKRRLQFNERLEDRLRTPDYWKRSYMRCLNRDYTADVFEYLLAVELKPLELPRTSNITRACVINWLMKVNGVDGNPATIQTACWYLDSILGIGHVQLDKLQLIAAACYWIAQKLHGPFMPALRLVKCANKAFTTEKLLAAEKAVLLKLRFPRQPVVAQDYITYFAWWCDTHRGEVEVAATFLCMCGLMVDRVLCDEFPSVIAAAAVRNALLLLRKKDLITRLHMCPIFKAAENKAASLSYTCSILRRAVRTVADPIYEYKAPFEHYSAPPFYIAQKIISAAGGLAVIDARNTDGR